MTVTTPLPIEVIPPSVQVPGRAAELPVKAVSGTDLGVLGTRLTQLWEQYRSDRRIAELRWLRNQRQYLGVYDPEIEQEMNTNRSKAYPKITRVKAITVLAKIMELMFPGNERNWELTAAPDPDMSMDDVREAIADAMKRDQAANVQPPNPMTVEYGTDAVHQLMVDRAAKLSVVLDDQLKELGGDQTSDHVSLNRDVLQSGINYGLGLLMGPFARKSKAVRFEMVDDPSNPGQQLPMPKAVTHYRPQFEFVPVWDFYPDLAAKTFASMDGYFIRKVMSKSQVSDLRKRPDFFCEMIDAYLTARPVGNHIAMEFEQELRVMGVKANVNEMKSDSQKYDVKVWRGKVDGHMLQQCGADVPRDKLTEQVDAEVWMIDGWVIKADLNAWHKLDVDVKTIHPFLYDRDDTSPIGFGLPNAMRDSQMMVSAATRMLLDNASVTCGPNVELNTDLLRADQDLSSIRSYRIWYREGLDVNSQYPAVRNIPIDAHMKDLISIIELGLKFADAETFVGPANGADPSSMPSEPLRTAAGASMLRGSQALPFKDMVRAFDSFTQSVLTSMIAFNRVFNPNDAHVADYNVIPRGATSLIEKEVRGAQADQLAATLTDEEKVWVDAKKLLSARLRARDMEDVMVSDAEAARRQKQRDDDQQRKQDQDDEVVRAQIRKLVANAYKDVAAGQKNTSAADANSVDSFLSLLERGVAINGSAAQPVIPPGGSPGAQAPSEGGGGGPDGQGLPAPGGPQGGGGA